MHRVTPDEAADYFLRCAQAVEAVDDALDQAQAVIISVVETIHWESFTPEQRISLKDWHESVQAACKSLRLPNV